MHKISGGCHCKNLRVELELARPPGAYNPRACDCDFCRKHGASYVSDAQGRLLIRIHDGRESATYRQGSGQAEFLLCRRCGNLVAVLYRSGAQLHGAVNARAIDTGTGLGPEQPVSPRTLSGEDKAKRWQDIWFRDVTISSVDP